MHEPRSRAAAVDSLAWICCPSVVTTARRREPRARHPSTACIAWRRKSGPTSAVGRTREEGADVTLSEKGGGPHELLPPPPLVEPLQLDFGGDGEASRWIHLLAHIHRLRCRCGLYAML